MPRSSVKGVNTENARKTDVLLEALPYIQKFSGETFVIKCGGAFLDQDDVLDSFSQNVVLLKNIGVNVIVVHGGGAKISGTLEKLGIETKFVNGIRVTTKEALDVVEMVLSGSVNKRVVHSINAAGGVAMGMSGKDASLLMATKAHKTYKDTDSNIERILDVGFVGVPTKVNSEILELFSDTLMIPVISPVGFDETTGQTYNINADLVAGAIASSLRAKKLFLLTDVDGVKDAKNKTISTLTVAETNKLIRTNVISGGMLPKVDTCLSAIEAGVSSVHIINGMIQNALLLDVLTNDGTGTMFYGDS